MKRTFLIVIMVVCLAALNGYAQMGGGMMGGQQGTYQQNQQMMSGTFQMMGQMSRMMQTLSNIMKSGLNDDEMRELSVIADDMSRQMNEMTTMSGTGYTSQQKMLQLQQWMNETERKLRMMRQE